MRKLEFKKVKYSEIPTIREYLKRNTNKSCDFSLANNFIWNQEEKLNYAILEENLVYRLDTDTEVLYYTPYFHNKVEVIIEAMIGDAKEIGKAFRLVDLSEEMITQMKERFPDRFEYSFYRDSSDYIYEVESLIKLSGKKYHGKKNHVNKFLKTFEYEYEEINLENIPECRIMKNQWGVLKGNEDKSLEKELKAVDIALDHYEELGLIGGLIRVEGEVKAFTIGERLTEDTFVTHIEKAYDEIPGLYPMMNQQFALHSLEAYRYVNREEDLGIEGLRKAKLSYHPVLLWNKYYAKLN